MELHTTPCRSCQAPIVWTVTTNGKRMPIDETPTPGRTGFLIDGTQRPPIARYVRNAEPGVMVYRAHWATCPYASQHRKPAAPYSEPTTSREAAIAKESSADTDRRKVYGVIWNHGLVTCEEIESLTGLEGNTVRPRLWELEKAGHIEKTDVRRKNRSGRAARAYRATELKLL